MVVPIILLATISATEVDAQAPPYRVEVRVAFDSPQRRRFERCVRRELGELEGVQVVEEGSHLELILSVTELGQGKGVRGGYAASESAVKNADPLWQGPVLVSRDLEALCRTAVARFDDEVLETLRESEGSRGR
jgi:hypothetical protein